VKIVVEGAAVADGEGDAVVDVVAESVALTVAVWVDVIGAEPLTLLLTVSLSVPV
jgi:hypothetical protein